MGEAKRRKAHAAGRHDSPMRPRLSRPLLSATRYAGSLRAWLRRVLRRRV
jgi:hypothetical protein